MFQTTDFKFVGLSGGGSKEKLQNFSSVSQFIILGLEIPKWNVNALV